MMAEKAILRSVERLNRRVNGGWVTITAHPIFGMGRWVIQIEPTGGHHVLTIASGFGLRDMIRRADAWVTDRATTNDEFQVAEYLDSDEYAAWCKRTLSSRLLAKDNVVSEPTDSARISACSSRALGPESPR